MYTKPADFAAADVSQNVATTTTTAVGLKVHNKQTANTIDIKSYEIKVSASGHSPSYSITASNTSSDGTSSIVVGTSPTLVSNKTYSISHIFLKNIYDLSK